MNLRKAIYVLLKRFRGANGTVSHTTISGTTATFTAPKDCWITFTGLADSGITLAPIIFLSAGGETLASGIGVAYQGTGLTASAYVKKGTQVSAQAYRCQLTGVNVDSGGYNPCNSNAFSIREGVLAA